MKTFDTLHYIDIIREKLNENKGERGYQAQMARAMGVHGSYLSRAIQGSVHLTPDQAAHLARFWEMRPLEAEYFITLLHFARAGAEPLKAFLRGQIAELRKKNQDLSVRFKDKNTEQASEIYYSAWQYGAIHLLLTVPGHSTIKAIANRLGLSLALTGRYLRELEKIGLAQRSGDRWLALHNNLHLSNGSLWAHVHHSNWRQKSIMKIQEREDSGILFTGIHAVSRADFEKMKNVFLDAIERCREIAGPSTEEDIYCFAVDAFQV